MITNLKFKNCFSFKKEAELNLEADLRATRLKLNYHNIKNSNPLKSVLLYGPNNSGKTNVIKVLKALKNILLNEDFLLTKNFFNDENDLLEISVDFLYNSKKYNYTFKYNVINEEFVYEKFSEIRKDEYSNKKEKIFFLKDFTKKVFSCNEDKKLEELLNIISTNNIIIHILQTEKFPILKQVETILSDFANKIEILDMNHANLTKTIYCLKNKNSDFNIKVKKIMKKADLNLEDYKYNEKPVIKFNTNNNEMLEEGLKLTSVYKGQEFPSLLYDSEGTLKIASLSSYIVEAIEKGKILVIDEIDSSLHFVLTRQIVALFNNVKNTKGQLIATTHDITLLDIKKLLRKEQIYFTENKNYSSTLKSLSEFSYKDSGIRETSDLIDKYVKGHLGAISEPELISVFLSEEAEDYELD